MRMPHVSRSAWSKARRLTQIACLAAFLFLLVRSEFAGSFRGLSGPVRLPWPVSAFLEADPLAAAATALSTHTLYRTMWWSLVILVPTFFLGRFFCGWICPLGALHHFVSSWKSEKKRGKALLDSNRYKRWHAAKYYVLAAVLVSALFGSAVSGVLDPIPLTVRSVGLAILPGANYAAGAVMDAWYQVPSRPVRLGADVAQTLLQFTVAEFRQPHFRQAFLLGTIFIGLLALNLRVTRFWCRAVCPLGALLGVASRWSLVHLRKDPDQCDSCNKCLLHCQGGDDPIPGPKWRKAECHLCMNCVADCPTSGIAFEFGRASAPQTTREAPEASRRRLLASAAAGAALVPLLRSTTGFAVDADSRLIRPPGALDERHFLERCIRCGECMKVCPNNALHPTLAEGGLEALWTPVLVPRVGYCEPSCVLCGQVCPTGAIWELTEAEKVGPAAPAGAAAGTTPARDGRSAAGPVKIGTAFYDLGRCLPWSMATDCIVCEEWCPTTPKAIFLLSADVSDSEGRTKTVRRPQVDPVRCTGCGACEYACPVKDRPAVYVTSVGESRSRTNQFILPPAPKR
jgi:polyferredoxin